jgi:uncharacterized LabA/DUF88 family protein
LVLPHQERVNIAVFIDFDNIEIGVKTTLGEHFDIGVILEALKERGEVVTKIAYADWTRAGEYSRALTQHAIRLVQRNLTPGGDKNGADINLALDALEMAFTHPHINAYVIVGGDSDFLSLVEKLKQYDKKVFVVGGRAFTSIILQRNCHEFIAYENLVRKPSARTATGRQQAIPASSPIAQAFPIVRRALKILADREVSPQTGLLKSTLLQLDSTFSERNYGASSFLDFVEKLTQAGLVQLKHSGRSVMVELNPSFADETDTSTGRPESAAASQAGAAAGSMFGAQAASGFVPGSGPAPVPGDSSSGVPTGSFDGQTNGMSGAPSGLPAEDSAPLAQAGDNAEGVRLAGQLLAAATTARWPMYLRNVKQILRAGAFDERRYGFGGLIDLLRACQRDGFVRMERDRRGGLRVFQGPAIRPATTSVPQDQGYAPQDRGDATQDHTSSISAEPVQERDGELDTMVQAIDQIIAIESLDPDVIIEAEPVSVIDTTAELLGRAKPRRPRTRAAGAPVSRTAATPVRGGARSTTPASRKTAKKPAPPARRTTSRTTKKSSDGDDENRGNR